jgi:PAS domain S-box-containing protein
VDSQDLKPSEPRAVLQQYKSRMRTLFDVGYRVALDTPLDETLPFILNVIFETTNAVSARIILDDVGDDYATVECGLDIDGLDEVDQAIHKYCLENGEVAIGNTAKPPKGLILKVLEGSIGAILTIPLSVESIQYGTIWLGFLELPQFTEDEREFLDLLILQVVVAISHEYTLETSRSERTHLEALLTTDLEPIIIIDTNRQIQVFNPAAELVFNTKQKDAFGKPFDKIVDSEILRDMMHASQRSFNDLEFLATDGRTFSPHVSEVHDSDGNSIGWLLVLRDVTRFKRLSENMSDFLHTVSHDIRSPMTAAKGFVDMLTMVGPANEKQEQFIGKILTSIMDMTNLVEKVLDAGRLDPDMPVYEIKRETSDPSAIVTKVVSTLSNTAEQKEIKLNAKVADNVPIMNLDEMMIERALLNLVENAIKYTPEGGEVLAECKIEGEDLIFAVHDNGLGISPEDQSRLFERGERIRRQEHKRIRGSGLGLFIVANVARKHGGDAWVESELDKGSTFYISIPLSRNNVIGGGE